MRFQQAGPGSTVAPPYGALSYWHDTAPPRRASRLFEHDARFDVAIVGGGYTGLWTAYHLLAQNPTLSIALLERHEVGFGASGRNGGFAMSLMHHSLHHLVQALGVEAARTIRLA